MTTPLAQGMKPCSFGINTPPHANKMASTPHGHRLRSVWIGLMLAAASICFTPSSKAETKTFTGGSLTITDNQAANPYPSMISITGINGRVSAVRVKINGFSHTFPADVDAYLVAPDLSYAAVFSDAGASFDVAGINLVFDDDASTVIPETTAITSGTYRPANYASTETAPPGALGLVLANLTALAGGGANGVWKLYVQDDAPSDSGSIASWEIEIITGLGSIAEARTEHTATLLPNGMVLVAGGISAAGILASAELYDPATGTWGLTGPLNTARYDHTATLLTDGRVLVAGGDSAGSISSAELYDPTTGMWSPATSLGCARKNHTATLLMDGNVLFVGGDVNDVPLSSVELYDPTGPGSCSSSTSLTTARNFHTATLLTNGMLLVAGGLNGGSISSVELFNPSSGVWSPLASMGTARRKHTSTLMPDGSIFVAGGIDAGGGTLASTERYTPVLGTWSPSATMVISRHSHTATLTPKGYVLVAGGNGSAGSSVAIYNGGAWAVATSLDIARLDHTATMMPNGRILIAGGDPIDGGGAKSTELLETSFSAFWYTTPGAMFEGRIRHTSTLLPNGKVLLVGGYIGGALPTTMTYNPVSFSWSSAALLPDGGRYSHTATLLPNGKVLIAGGRRSGVLGSTELYNPALDSWSTASSMAGVRQNHTATLLFDGRVLVVGGVSSVFLSSAEIYDSATDSWSPAASLGTARGYHTATLMPNGKVLVTGGLNGGDLTTAEEYDPALDTWSVSSIGNHGRNQHTATLLLNGKVLLAGGVTNSSAILYDPASSNWTAAADLPFQAVTHTATLLPNGKVLVVGGIGGATQIYDPELEAWSIAPASTDSRYQHTATLLANGSVLVAGTTVGNYTNRSELYYASYDDPSALRTPAITAASINVLNQLELTGKKFMGLPVASAGNGSQDGSSDFPLVQWRRLDNEQSFFLLPDPDQPFSATGFTSRSFASLNGHAIVTVFANGHQSVSFIMCSAGSPYISLMRQSPSEISLTMSGVHGGLDYAQEQTADLVDEPWTTGSVITAQSDTLVVTNVPSGPAAYWRLRRSGP